MTKAVPLIRHFSLFLVSVLSLTLSLVPASAQMVSGDRMTDYATVFDLGQTRKAKTWSVTQTGSSLGTNVLHPGETIALTFCFQNLGVGPLQTTGTIEIIAYGTTVPPGDFWTPTVHRTPGEVVQQIPITLDIPAKGGQTLTVNAPIGDRFGTYALIADLGDRGRAFAATVARTLAPDEGAVAFPAYALDMPRFVTPSSMALFRKIGAKASRMELGAFDPDAPDAEKRWAELDEKFKLMRANNVTVMLTIGAGTLPQPLNAPRPWLDANGVQLPGKADYVWLPEADPKFTRWIKTIATRWGYPKGPVNAMELWNEPWDGISISGWGADIPRYRELFRAFAQGIHEARDAAKVQVLIGGASSSSNTLDKLFPDGSDEFLPLLDFTSIHYQVMAAAPALIKQFQNRKPVAVQTWDTESWIANSEDRVAAVVASMRAMGQDRVVGIFSGNVYDAQQGRQGTEAYDATQAWNVTPAIAAATKFIGNRKFGGLLFQNGLPWIFTFDGAPPGTEAAAQKTDNGTLVIVGDLRGAYDEKLLPFRDVVGLQNVAQIDAAEKTFAALPPRDKQAADSARLGARLLTGASLTLSYGGGKFRAFDFVGNPVPPGGGTLTIPLDTLGYYLRTDGTPGSFAALKKAVAAAGITGYTPLHIVAHDFTAPIGQHPALRLELTNILNRPVSGSLNMEIPGVTFQTTRQTLQLQPHETRTVLLPVIAGQPTVDNSYALRLKFDAGVDGTAVHTEILHCNVISRRTVAVDGDLGDWKGVLPQPAGGEGIATSLAEKAWLPFLNFEDGIAGVSNGYLAYDDRNFYFAAKIADATPDEGTLNFASRDDDQFYYPEVSYALNTATSLQKKDTVSSVEPTDPRTLQKPDGDSRVLAYYETTNTKSFAVDITTAGNAPRQVALYFADRDPGGRRAQIVELQGADGQVLDSRPLKAFASGRYLVYTVHGKVRFKITARSGLSAVLSAVFFDPAPTALATADAASAFLREDADTAGSWKGKYGASGYHFAALHLEKLPDGVTLAVPEFLDKTPLSWPAGVRRYSYRQRPILPFNTGDDVQIAFNVLPDASKPWLMNPPGVPPKWMLYPDTDYEYSLLQNAPQYGGKTEVWRLYAPGMPRKHFYPRQPKWPGDALHQQGDVTDARLVMRRDGNTRIVEMAMPWTEIPDVKARLDAGQTVKFSYRVGDNGGQPYELAQGRSVSKSNFYAFHPDFNTHWANEVEFGWEK